VDIVLPDVRDNFQDHLVRNFSAFYKFNGMDWLDLDSETGRTGFLLPKATLPVAGGDVGAPLPPAASPLVTKVVAAQRGARNGRMFLPPYAEGSVNEHGVILAADVTVWQTRVDAFFNGIEDDVIGGIQQHPVVSTVLTRGPSPAPGIPGPPLTGEGRRVTSFRYQNVIATQRRRQKR
jgi:hypothetical protein